jgi:chitin disaccharide deacetylase
MATRLILCADDYALTPGVSRGILKLVALRRLSAVGCMTNRPGWLSDAPALLAYRALGKAEEGSASGGRAAIGLHLNLTLGAPLGPMPLLAPDGKLPAFGALAKLAFTWRVSTSEVEAEICRQLDAFEQAAGSPPDFVDGHQHVHVLPVVRSALFEVLTKRSLAGRIWLRDPCDQLASIMARGIAVPKALVIGALGAGFGKRARALGFATNRGFAGVSPFDPSRDFGADMARFLIRPGPAHLVMCHPGAIDDELRGLDPVIDTRPQELAYLASDRFKDLLAATQTILVSGPL